MKQEIKEIVEQAIAPLKTEIAELKTQIESLLAMAKPPELPATIKEAQAILKSIPVEVLEALKVVNAGFDPKMVWFQLLRQDGTSISIKKQEFDFRLRLRDQSGALLREISPSLNGLVATLKSLA